MNVFLFYVNLSINGYVFNKILESFILYNKHCSTCVSKTPAGFSSQCSQQLLIISSANRTGMDARIILYLNLYILTRQFDKWYLNIEHWNCNIQIFDLFWI